MKIHSLDITSQKEDNFHGSKPGSIIETNYHSKLKKICTGGHNRGRNCDSNTNTNEVIGRHHHGESIGKSSYACGHHIQHQKSEEERPTKHADVRKITEARHSSAITYPSQHWTPNNEPEQLKADDNKNDRKKQDRKKSIFQQTHPRQDDTENNFGNDGNVFNDEDTITKDAGNGNPL